ncbi:hypothetical protein NC661_05790 [Aquibacillus koreensis]|uniref:Uncharacterized protein n=1 Tax=Aquibacillus koreensis TaxID=279446 RepID=A0A9X3WJ48_9BACI|nr:hypothetical protein [Aquibacillus koreensis]MCT2537139.1 hypothetical protein [Aquibacillus koreensis]MDC3419878.1 hypothetical protein [Aquibacillus koreensis]
MLLYFPEKFDINEWTILITVVFNIGIFLFMRKRIPKEITPLIVLLSISFPQVMDHSMGVKPFNYYDLTDSNKYELFDVILYGAYPAFGYLFVYFLDYLNLKGKKLVLYFLSWALFSVVFELLLVKLHVYVYNGWKIYYSLPVYLVVLSLTFLLYKFLIYYNKHEHTNVVK